MLIRDIIAKMQLCQDNFLFLENRYDFATVTYKKTDSMRERGIYLPDIDSGEALEWCKNNTPDGYLRIKSLIERVCTFDALSFCVFSILHELGHWLQYCEYIHQGHNDCEFIFQYETERIILLNKRKKAFEECTTEDDVKQLNSIYENEYSKLPTEQYANKFAVEHLNSALSILTHE